MTGIEKLYRYVATLLILGVMLMQTFSNAVIVGGYYLNTGGYARYCVNKAKPWMHCNGKCQMLKKLNQEEKQDNQNPVQKAASVEVISSKSFFSTVPEPASVLHTVIFISRNDNRLQQMPRSLLRPPCLLLSRFTLLQ